MAHAEDRWISGRTRQRTSCYGRGGRWRAVWTGPDGKRYSKSFSAGAAAAQHAAAMADDAIFQRLLADAGRGGAR